MVGHFVVYLNDGYRFDFDEKCNFVNDSNRNVMEFWNVNEKDDKRTILAIIPYSNIKYVLGSRKDEEEGE